MPYGLNEELRKGHRESRKYSLGFDPALLIFVLIGAAAITLAIQLI